MNNMKIIIAGLIIFACLSTVQAGNVRTGDKVVLSEHRIVRIVNKQPLAQWQSVEDFRMLREGDECVALESGVVTVVEVKGNKLLVEYTSPGVAVQGYCPNGALFYMDANEFRKELGKKTKPRKWRTAEKDIIREKGRYPALKNWSLIRDNR